MFVIFGLFVKVSELRFLRSYRRNCSHDGEKDEEFRISISKNDVLKWRKSD